MTKRRPSVLAGLILSSVAATAAPALGGYTFTSLATAGSSLGSGVMLDAGKNLYGVAYSGGQYGAGYVYKVSAGTHAVTTLASFTGGSGGSNPNGTPVM